VSSNKIVWYISCLSYASYKTLISHPVNFKRPRVSVNKYNTCFNSRNRTDKWTYERCVHYLLFVHQHVSNSVAFIIRIIFNNTRNQNKQVKMYKFLFLWLCVPTRIMASSLLRFLDQTQRRTTVGRTPPDGYQLFVETSDNTQHSLQTNIHALVEFEPTISAGERPQTYALDSAATGTG
jgi:hypothetical protein